MLGARVLLESIERDARDQRVGGIEQSLGIRHGILWHQIAQAHGVGDALFDIKVGFGLEERVEDLLVGEDVAVGVLQAADFVDALELRAGRQHHVGVVDDARMVDVGDCHEVELLQPSFSHRPVR